MKVPPSTSEGSVIKCSNCDGPMGASHQCGDFSMLSPTVIGVGLHRLGLKSNFGQVEVQRGEAELDFNLTEIGLHWSCTR